MLLVTRAGLSSRMLLPAVAIPSGVSTASNTVVIAIVVVIRRRSTPLTWWYYLLYYPISAITVVANCTAIVRMSAKKRYVFAVHIMSTSMMVMLFRGPVCRKRVNCMRLLVLLI